jgi:PhnB protein
MRSGEFVLGTTRWILVDEFAAIPAKATKKGAIGRTPYLPENHTKPVNRATAKKETAMQVQPYLDFEGRCDEALELYKKALGAKVDMLMRFKEAPDQSMVSPSNAEKVMHAAMHVGDTQILMSDGRCQGNANFGGFSLCISAPSEAEAVRMFNALADGGEVRMPMAKTFFSPKFGMVADKFGVGWMVLVEH